MRYGQAKNTKGSGKKSFVPGKKWISAPIVRKEAGPGLKESASDFISLVMDDLFLQFFQVSGLAAAPGFAIRIVAE
jgi:hypothetical protein